MPGRCKPDAGRAPIGYRVQEKFVTQEQTVDLATVEPITADVSVDATAVAQNLIAKVDAGAQLTFAVWSLPKPLVADLFKNAPLAFTKAYAAACEAYGIGGH